MEQAIGDQLEKKAFSQSGPIHTVAQPIATPTDTCYIGIAFPMFSGFVAIEEADS